MSDEQQIALIDEETLYGRIGLVVSKVTGRITPAKMLEMSGKIAGHSSGEHMLKVVLEQRYLRRSSSSM